MAALGLTPLNIFGRRSFSPRNGLIIPLQRKYSGDKLFQNFSLAKKLLISAAGAITAGAIGTVVALETSVKARDLILHPPKFDWSHNKFWQSLDHASVRRGYFVYKQVCAACHSMTYIHYRQLVNVCLTEEEARREAAEILVQDGPDDEGNMFERPGKLSDALPNPYANDEAAKAANNGALPPDLSMIVFARHGGEDYIFSLLTGYSEAPAGIELRDGLSYNAYFPGGSIGMAQQLFNEGIEYEDGTAATVSQMAKDVATFLKMTADYWHDDRKRLGIKTVMVLSALCIVVYYQKRHVWATVKSAKRIFKKPEC